MYIRNSVFLISSKDVIIFYILIYQKIIIMDGSTRIILDKELAKLSIESLIRHVIQNSY
jgi:hypothetical protein